MKLLVLIPLLFTCCFVSTPSGAQQANTPSITTPDVEKVDVETVKNKWPTFEAAFKDGVASYEAKQYQEARLAFGRALELNSESLNTLVNLGMTEFQLGEKGLAVALLRKAVTLDPNFSTSRAALDVLRAWGCDEVQGYFTGRPMSGDALVQAHRNAADAGAGAR